MIVRTVALRNCFPYIRTDVLISAKPIKDGLPIICVCTVMQDARARAGYSSKPQ
jgi:hypothetical protein